MHELLNNWKALFCYKLPLARVLLCGHFAKSAHPTPVHLLKLLVRFKLFKYSIKHIRAFDHPPKRLPSSNIGQQVLPCCMPTNTKESQNESPKRVAKTHPAGKPGSCWI
jgi:hypothetical protein